MKILEEFQVFFKVNEFDIDFVKESNSFLYDVLSYVKTLFLFLFKDLHFV